MNINVNDVESSILELLKFNQINKIMLLLKLLDLILKF